MAKAKKKPAENAEEPSKTKISFKLKAKPKGKKPSKVKKSKPKAEVDKEDTTDLTSLKNKIDKLENALQDKENVIQALQDEAREQLNLIKEIQKRARAPKAADQKAKVFEKISRLGKIKGDKVREGQRTISGILMGLSFHLYFSLHNIEKFTISALLLFSGLCFFMSVMFTFVPDEKWEHFPTYLLILGASSLVVNSNFVILYRFDVSLATAWTDGLFIFIMFPIVLGIIGIIYAVQEGMKRR